MQNVHQVQSTRKPMSIPYSGITASVLEDVKCFCNDERGLKMEITSRLRSSEFQTLIFYTEHFRNCLGVCK